MAESRNFQNFDAISKKKSNISETVEVTKFYMIPKMFRMHL